MKRLLQRFYFILSITVILASTILFVNINSFKIDGSYNNVFSFIVILFVFLLQSFSLMILEYKMYDDKKLSYIMHSFVFVLFVIQFIFNFSGFLLGFLSVIVAAVLLAKMILYQKFSIIFKVNDFRLITWTYTAMLFSVVLINFYTTNYIASIFSIIPLLLLEAEIYFKIRLEKPNYDYNLLGSLSILIVTFFLSYYSIVLKTEDFSFLFSLLFPAVSLLLVLLSYSLVNKKIEFIIKTMSIE